jgi:hypothetical protein
MSMDRCADCSEAIDTDEDLECYQEDGRCICINCRKIEDLARRYFDEVGQDEAGT